MRSRPIGFAACVFVIVASCGRDSSSHSAPSVSPPPSTPVATSGTTGNAPVRVTFSNVDFHVEAGAVVEVSRLSGALMTTRPGQPPVFDDLRSFMIEVDSGEMAISPVSLTRLLNANVFSFKGSPLTDVEVTIEGGRLKQKATLHKGIPVPVSMEAEISAARDGRARLHPTSLSVGGIPSRGLMKTFGLELDDLVDSYKAHGFEIAGDDLLLDTGRLVTAPMIKGRLASIRISGDRIIQVFGDSPPAGDRASRARNSMQYRGGVLRFGKLTMTDTDMQLIDADPSDPFDFDPARYVRQLVAGYSKNTPDGGLRVYMPDFNEAARRDLKP
jgi:hypothetical protein